MLAQVAHKVGHKRLTFMCRKVLRCDETHPWTTWSELGWSEHTCRSLQFFEIIYFDYKIHLWPSSSPITIKLKTMQTILPVLRSITNTIVFYHLFSSFQIKKIFISCDILSWLRVMSELSLKSCQSWFEAIRWKENILSYVRVLFLYLNDI